MASSPISEALSPRQAEVLAEVLTSGAMHCLLYGGARSTKTWLLCFATAVRALSAANSRHLICRLHHVDVRISVMMDTWPAMMRKAFPDLGYEVNKADQFVVLPTGSEVWFGGLDDKERVEKVLGREYATIYANECSQIGYQAILTLRTRLAQSAVKADGRPLKLKAYYDLNPVGRGHWTHKEFIEGISPVDGTKFEEGTRRYGVLNPVDNPWLPAETLAEYRALPTRQRQRFYEGKYLSEIPGALWPLDLIESLRAPAPELARIIVAIDPSGSDGTSGDSQGIIVAGLGVDGEAYVLEDCSCRLSPEGWARRAVDAYHRWQADIIVAETNFGAAMVESTIRTADKTVPFKRLVASRGKHVRAEPVAALYEQRKVHHVLHESGKPNPFAALEEQMGMFTTEGYEGSGSPDRVDALVWALTELMVKRERTRQGIALPEFITSATL